MTTILVALFGLLPAILLALPAFVVLIGGLVMLVEDPAQGALLTAWAFAGLYGTRTLIQVAFGTYTDNTVPGLLAGIAAAAPLAYLTLQAPHFPESESLLPLYFTTGPIIVAAGYIAEILLFESADKASIVGYEDA